MKQENELYEKIVDWIDAVANDWMHISHIRKSWLRLNWEAITIINSFVTCIFVFLSIGAYCTQSYFLFTLFILIVIIFGLSGLIFYLSAKCYQVFICLKFIYNKHFKKQKETT